MSSLGADHVIDYTREDFADGTRRYDLILDIAGNPSLKRLRRALEPRGTVVFVGGENAGSVTGDGTAAARHAALGVPAPAPRAARVQGTRDRLRAAHHPDRGGEITPTLDRSYPLEDAPEAMRLLETGQVRGKVAITI